MTVSKRADGNANSISKVSRHHGQRRDIAPKEFFEKRKRTFANTTLVHVFRGR